MVHEIGLSSGLHLIGESFAGMGAILRNEVLVQEILEETVNGGKPRETKRLFKEIINGEYDWLEEYKFDLSSIKEDLERMVKEMR